MSTITITTEDKQMSIDGNGYKFDLGLDDDIWAIQWDTKTNKGEVEYRDHKIPNKDITEFPELAALQTKYDEAVASEIERLQKIEANKNYKEKRLEQYGLLEQEEMQYDDKINGTNNWVEAIQAIKKTYPKTDEKITKW